MTFDEYINEIYLTPLLSSEEEIALITKINDGDKNSYDYFINCNLRLVLNVIDAYSKYYYIYPREDMFQDGVLGLMKAIEKFDISLKHRFSTYAYWWINGYILKRINLENNLIYISQQKYFKLLKLIKIAGNSKEPLGNELSIDELILKFNRDNIINIEMLLNDQFLEKCMRSDINTIDDIIFNNDLKDKIRELLDTSNISSIDKEIIMKRFGFYGKLYNNTELAKEYKITAERIRQRCLKALRQIRSNPKVKYLSIYMDYPEQALKSLDKPLGKHLKMTYFCHEKRK